MLPPPPPPLAALIPPVLLKDRLRCRLCDSRSLLLSEVVVLIGGRGEGCLLAMARRLVVVVLVFWGVLVVFIINEICCCGEETAAYELLFGDHELVDVVAVVGLPVLGSPGLGLANTARGGVCGEDSKCGGGTSLLSIV
jgi:hypothetical protein